MHGTIEAEGTDWASTSSGCRAWQFIVGRQRAPCSGWRRGPGVGAGRWPAPIAPGRRRQPGAYPAHAPALNPDWRWPAGQEPQELVVQFAAAHPDGVPQLGRQCEAAGGSERLRDLRHGEELQRPLVDNLGAAAQRQAQHHVAQVDRLAPRCRAHLGEGDVDQQQAAVTDQQVGRLDVAVGQSSVPHLANDQQPVVDDLLVDRGVAQLRRPGEELGDQQVLPVRGELDEAVRRRARQPGVTAEPQCVILLLDEAADAFERRSSSSRPYRSCRPSLYQRSERTCERAYSLPNRYPPGSPARRSRIGLRPAGAGQPERLDAGHLDAHLLIQRAPDRLAARAAEVKMRTVRAAVDHRERLLRGEQPHPQQRHRHAEDARRAAHRSARPRPGASGTGRSRRRSRPRPSRRGAATGPRGPACTARRSAQRIPSRSRPTASLKPAQRNWTGTPKGSGRCTTSRKIVVSRVSTS